jgi:hypothetical protein
MVRAMYPLNSKGTLAEHLDMRWRELAQYSFAKDVCNAKFMEYVSLERNGARFSTDTPLMDPYLPPRALPSGPQHALRISVYTLRLQKR